MDLLVRPKQAEEADSIPGVVSTAMRKLLVAIEQARISLNTDSVEKLVEMIGLARRIIVLAENPAQATAYNLVHFLEQGGFLISIARSGVADLARTIHTATSGDLLLALEVSGEAPYIASTLEIARQREIQTATILGSASLASARAADVVLAARAQTSLGVGIISIEAIIYALSEALRWRYADRFSGAEQAIMELSDRIHTNKE
jgi:DNA-binding MurR/RpiR family transcriptional regulator